MGVHGGVSRAAGAWLRAAVMALLVALPQGVLGTATAEGAQLAALAVLVVALFTLSEYGGRAPSLVEFRDAPPFNRLRAATAFASLLLICVMLRPMPPDATSGLLLQVLGERLGLWLDWPGSPVHLALIALGSETASVPGLRAALAVSYALSLGMVAVFGLVLIMGGWPRPAPFNIWINLPRFDPAAGGDVRGRLMREAHVNLVLGFLLPFLLPVTVILGDVGSRLPSSPAALAWMVAAWSLLPASFAMRGLAFLRLAHILAAQRARGDGTPGRLQPA